MKTNLKKLEKSQIEINFELDTEEFSKYVDKALEHLKGHVKMDGFRKGKVPKDIVKKEVGQESLLMEAGDLAVKESYGKFVNENNFEPIGKSEVKITKIVPIAEQSRIRDGGAIGTKEPVFVFTIKVSILPEVNLPDYKKIAQSVKKREVSVRSQEIEDSLNFLQKSRAKFTTLLSPAKTGDFVEIEYEAAGIEKIKDAFILGEGKFVPGFEKELTGMTGGQEKEFSLTFPEDFSRKDLAGKKVDFKTKMLSVQKMELPELNDEFAQNLGNFLGVAELRKNIEEGLTEEKRQAEIERQRAEILGRIAENSKLEIPESLVEAEKNQMMEGLKQKISQDLKIPFENYLKTIQQSEEGLKETFFKEAEKKVRNFLVLREIGKKENIFISEPEIEKELNKVIKNYHPENLKKLDLSRLKEYIKSAKYNEKVFQILEKFSQ